MQLRCMRSCLGAREKESPRLMHVVALQFTLYLFWGAFGVPPWCPNGVSLSGRRIAVESGRARATDRGSGGLGLAKGYVIGWLFLHE